MLKASSVPAVLLMVIVFIISSVVPHPLTYAETVVDEIDTEDDARFLAVKAQGTYIEGATVPTLSGSDVALPVLDEATGEVLGYIVADQIKLISALNELGMVDVASAVAAISVGEAAGAAAGTGFSMGTTGKIVAAIAVLGTGIAVAAGGGGGSSTPPSH